MQIHPAKWRAWLTAEGLVVATFLAYDSEPFEVQIPLQMLRKMVQIFREMLGRPAVSDLGYRGSMPTWRFRAKTCANSSKIFRAL